jgi:aspartokinase-like uncharacterized kinase
MSKHLVIKLGGASLFHASPFQAPLSLMLQEYSQYKIYLIAGGGDLIESMRTIHRIHPSLDPVHMHWRCVRLLNETCTLANELFPLGSTIETANDLMEFSQFASGSVPDARWVQVQSFYSEASVACMPAALTPRCGWETTTDALAWLLGVTVEAERVVLVKRADQDLGISLRSAAQQGIIDSELERLCQENGCHQPAIELRRLAA